MKKIVVFVVFIVTVTLTAYLGYITYGNNKYNDPCVGGYCPTLSTDNTNDEIIINSFDDLANLKNSKVYISATFFKGTSSTIIGKQNTVAPISNIDLNYLSAQIKSEKSYIFAKAEWDGKNFYNISILQLVPLPDNTKIQSEIENYFNNKCLVCEEKTCALLTHTYLQVNPIIQKYKLNYYVKLAENIQAVFEYDFKSKKLNLTSNTLPFESCKSDTNSNIPLTPSKINSTITTNIMLSNGADIDKLEDITTSLANNE